jgi:hypothetical protein
MNRKNASEGGVALPGGNGTGPLGLGPLTGRKAGFCAGYTAPGYQNPLPGFGWGRGTGGLLPAAGLIVCCAILACKWVNRKKTKKN